jgi:tRNA wybutosine-synthesizing protein 2
MRVRAVPKEKLRDIGSEDWVDRSRSPYVEENIVWVPVKDGEPFDRELPERNPYSGRGFFMLGDVAVIHGKKPTKSQVEEIVSFRHPRGVLWLEELSDVTRSPGTTLLWGDAGEVCHKESGYTYFLDPQKVMFSQGNRNEKMRMAGLVKNSGRPERVADMFAGIGYFTIPVAGSGAIVHAMEINPVAFGYLVRNIRINNLSDRITATIGDCRDLLDGKYDRILMGHFDAITMLPQALGHVQGGSVIHLHSIGSVEEEILAFVESAGFSATINVHKVKKYRPHTWHIVQDVILE